MEASLASDVLKQGSLAALIHAMSLIIWDEASMARKENVESLDLLFRDLCDENMLFGGKLVIFGGDLRHVLLVLPCKTQGETVIVRLVSSILWPRLKKFHLTDNIRAREDPAFSEFLLALGNGELQTINNSLVCLLSEGDMLQLRDKLVVAGRINKRSVIEFLPDYKLVEIGLIKEVQSVFELPTDVVIFLVASDILMDNVSESQFSQVLNIELDQIKEKNKMRRELFGDQIEEFKEAFMHKGEYEIEDAPIRNTHPQWKKTEDKLNFQMTFGR
ncbi:uncharacterized protein [Spinacia oleracea]|uniref:ATP-dependent DNA helicase n=1 Tax=Spinacia oleracea TaxID=3562 RepID=A0ABM3R1J6_SPIOL|nr:uncharacterized protein LOC130464091 [Spinacia oleracea]